MTDTIMQEAIDTIHLAELAQKLGRPDADAWFEKANAAFDHAVAHQGMSMSDDCVVCDARWRAKEAIKDAERAEYQRRRFERMVTQ